MEQDSPLYNEAFWSGTIIDTEWVTLQEEPSNALILAFDILMISGNVLRTTYCHRMSLLNQWFGTWVKHSTVFPLALRSEHAIVTTAHPNCMIAAEALPSSVRLAVKPVFSLSQLSHADQWCREYEAQFPCDEGLVLTHLKEPPTPYLQSQTGCLKVKLERETQAWSEHTVDFKVRVVTGDMAPVVVNRYTARFQQDVKETDGRYRYALWLGKPEQCFGMIATDTLLDDGRVYECGWLKVEQRWTILEKRRKRENTLRTVKATLRHIDEGLVWSDVQRMLRST